NPAATIAAVAERNIERFIRRVTGDARWQAPERAAATPIAEPLDQIVFPEGGTRPPDTSPNGFVFRETMSGRLHLGHVPPDDYPGGEHHGGAASSALEIVAHDLAVSLGDPNHTAVAHGTVTIAGLTPEGGAPIGAGVFNLLCPGEGEGERHFR